ncbi:MAG: chemotaxis protein CheW, partial [Candidatus Acidiferrales bacterium]
DDASATNVRLGIAADEVIGTYTAADDSLLDQMPSEIPHCRGMLRHDDRLALVLDLNKMIEVFPVPVI